ncbi:MAG TPA: hypothetical protein VMG12_08365 [Polyangiaceae bacterium]|nr:hypothetical protein [Polyangiaceae bacterium]
MHYSTILSGSTPAAAGRARLGRRLLGALIPAAALGLGLWLAPSDAAAAPRCTSKPAVCARIANERKARPQAAPVVARAQQPAPVAINRSPTQCGSKPIVCARLQANGTLRAAQPPVTLARNAAAGDRCTSKPAVCARLKMKAKGAPMTLAGDDPRQVD